jgi:hypothetical protein
MYLRPQALGLSVLPLQNHEKQEHKTDQEAKLQDVNEQCLVRA